MSHYLLTGCLYEIVRPSDVKATRNSSNALAHFSIRTSTYRPALFDVSSPPNHPELDSFHSRKFNIGVLDLVRLSSTISSSWPITQEYLAPSTRYISSVGEFDTLECNEDTKIRRCSQQCVPPNSPVLVPLPNPVSTHARCPPHESRKKVDSNHNLSCAPFCKTLTTATYSSTWQQPTNKLCLDCDGTTRCPFFVRNADPLLFVPDCGLRGLRCRCPLECQRQPPSRLSSRTCPDSGAMLCLSAGVG